MYNTFGKALLGAAMAMGAAAASASPLVTASVDDRITATLPGEVSPLLAKSRDLGALPDTEMLPHVTLVLRRPPPLQAAFDRLVRDQQSRTSPAYHRWLTPAQLAGYGPDAADVAKVVAWLQARGMSVNGVAPSRMSIDFAGTPSAVAGAFHIALHRVATPDGRTHIANLTNPAIPAALAPVVRGATLSDFFPRPDMIKAVKPARAHGAAHPGIAPQDSINGYQAMTPQDFNVVYDVNPLLAGTTGTGKLTGAGVTVAVIEQTDIMADDWKTFRKAFGLAIYAGKLVAKHPACTDPGFTADEGEAALDAEWIGVAAPDATVIEASCASTPLTFGVETALQGMVEHPAGATVFSISYGGPEQQNSTSFLAGWSNLLEEAASEGISVFVSSGDSGTSYDRNAIAVDGLAVNGLSSNPYNTTLGGTDFLDGSRGNTAAFWRPKNRAHFESAKSYAPEIPWDNSCAGAVVSSFGGYASGIESCNDPNNTGSYQNGAGGSGGESTLYPKPDFQNVGVPGMPADGMRDQPDVSLFSSNGFWGHFLVLCMSDPNEGGTTCDYDDVDDTFANGAGGTSFAAPSFAGIAALIVQKDGAVGLTAPRLYALAKAQFTNTSLAAGCISGRGHAISKACVFYNVTVGDIAEPCYATSGDCYTNAKAVEGIGVLRNDDQPTTNAYPAQQGYSLATGLGSVNVTNLVTAY